MVLDEHVCIKPILHYALGLGFGKGRKPQKFQNARTKRNWLAFLPNIEKMIFLTLANFLRFSCVCLAFFLRFSCVFGYQHVGETKHNVIRPLRSDGHVNFMLFVSFLFALGTQCERSVFWWNMSVTTNQL